MSADSGEPPGVAEQWSLFFSIGVLQTNRPGGARRSGAGSILHTDRYTSHQARGAIKREKRMGGPFGVRESKLKQNVKRWQLMRLVGRERLDERDLQQDTRHGGPYYSGGSDIRTS